MILQPMKLLRDIAVSHLLTVAPDATLRRAARIMTDRGVGAAVVMENERVAGIVTERDMLHAIAEGTDMESVTVGDIMTRDVVSGAPGWHVLQAVQTMTEHRFRHLLVTEMDEPVGIVSLRDLMDAIVEMVQEADASA